MGLLSRLLGREAAVQAPPAGEDHTDRLLVGLRFDESLVPRLKADHALLAERFMMVKRAAEAGDVETALARLREFKVAFQSHVAMENVRLYPYLLQPRLLDTASRLLAQNLRREMGDLYRRVTGFAERYRGGINGDHVLAVFKVEFDQIGRALAKRIEAEESALYSLYTRRRPAG